MDAIRAVVAGVAGRAVETEGVDVKEEAGSVSRRGRRTPVPPQHEPAARELAAATACMANSDRGGVIVVGVRDDVAGPAALVGAHLDVAWLRQRIHALTQPSYSVEIDEHHEDGVRLYVINVPPALEEIRCGDRLRTRQGTDCVELTGDRAREFLERRRGFDWTAQPSGLHLSSATRRALSLARAHYEAEHGLAPASDLELARRMGVLGAPGDGNGEDPELTRAGALLLTPFEPATDQIHLLVTPAEGISSTHSVRGRAPLLELFDNVWRTLTDIAFPARPTVIGAQRMTTRAVPVASLREAIVNAMMHRDYRLSGGAIVIHATGDPTDALKVRSPGGFPAGVRGDRLISTPSTPRNPALATAMRVLGLAEAEGVGVDAMYRTMLRAGHGAPVIVEDGGDVVVVLRGGSPDAGLLGFFESLSASDAALDDARVAIAITSLLTRQHLRPEGFAVEAQCTQVEALATLERLEAAGAVERPVNRSLLFRLTDHAVGQLGHRVRYPLRRRIDEHLEIIRAFLDTAPEIGRDEAASLLGVAPNTASRILSDLTRSGRLTHVANARGAGVRYRPSAATTPYRGGDAAER